MRGPAIVAAKHFGWYAMPGGGAPPRRPERLVARTDVHSGFDRTTLAIPRRPAALATVVRQHDGMHPELQSNHAAALVAVISVRPRTERSEPRPLDTLRVVPSEVEGRGRAQRSERGGVQGSPPFKQGGVSCGR